MLQDELKKQGIQDDEEQRCALPSIALNMGHAPLFHMVLHLPPPSCCLLPDSAPELLCLAAGCFQTSESR